MEAKIIRVERTFNTGNYSSLKLGGDFEVGYAENLDNAYLEAYRRIERAFELLMSEKKASEEEKSKKLEKFFK